MLNHLLRVAKEGKARDIKAKDVKARDVKARVDEKVARAARPLLVPNPLLLLLL